MRETLCHCMDNTKSEHRCDISKHATFNSQYNKKEKKGNRGTSELKKVQRLLTLYVQPAF